MQHYRFCVALRRPDGTLDTPVREEIIAATRAEDAVLAAKRIHVDMIGTGTNAIYLLDPIGHVIWSLRMGDVWLDPDDED
ncbi:hypothetical protein [Methylobacterium radiotolerans]|uniref:hypothetical protein n=1 Tax=Methylobacterium radiotolerans TaxID=31998 RepID=UPI0038CF8F7E